MADEAHLARDDVGLAQVRAVIAERGISFTGADTLELMAEVLHVSLGTLFEDGAITKIELEATPELTELVVLLRDQDPVLRSIALGQARLLLRASNRG